MTGAGAGTNRPPARRSCPIDMLSLSPSSSRHLPVVVEARCDLCRFRREQVELLTQRPLAYCTVRSFRPCADVNRDRTCSRFRAVASMLEPRRQALTVWPVVAALVGFVLGVIVLQGL